jgi:hypothetical protein
VLYATESEQKNADPSMLIYNLRNNPNLLLAENINMEE